MLLNLPLRLFSFASATLLVCGLATASKAQTVISVPNGGSLQDALNNVPDGGIIELANGTFTPPNGGYTVYPDLNGGSKSFTIRAAAGAAPVLDGGSASQIFTITTPKPVTFQNITFRHGLSTADFHGGAISISHVQALFSNCLFDANSASPPTTGGGAVWIDTSTVTFLNCVWTNNTSPNYAGALSSYQSRVYIRNSQFSGNRTNIPGQANFSAGGAIHGNSSTMQIANCRFENNQAGYVGGAIYTIGVYDTPVMDLQISDCLFANNVAVKDPSGPNTAPTTGGAVFMEDQTNAHFYNCRFTNNSAQQGGAISSYRTVTNLQNCVLVNNSATGGPGNGESLGGAIIVLSDDNPDQTTNSGQINRPSAQLTILDTLIQGPGQSATSARQGGGIFAGGDQHAQYGVTVQQNGTPETNRAQVTLQRVVFSNLATVDSAGNGTGGALTGSFIKLTADSCIIENCSSSQFGGGFEFVYNSDATITNTTFARNTSGVLGGSVTMFGGNLLMDACNMVENNLTNPGGGSALMTSADPGGGSLPAVDMTGTIQNCVISNNTGGPATIYDGTRTTAPFNRLQYSNNQIFPSDTSAYFFDGIGSRAVVDVNSMSISHPDNTTTVKAPIANISLNAAATIDAVLMVPRQTLTSGAPGETPPFTPFIAFASTGALPVLDGSAQNTNDAVIATSSDAQHTLTSGNTVLRTLPAQSAALNISTRLPVGQDDNALIGGFFVVGATPKRVMLRAIGPSLPVSGALQNPTLELHDSTGATIATNDNWHDTEVAGVITSPQSIDILGSTIAPTNDAEAAIIATLAPGSYTAVVRGAGNTTGIGLVEVFDLDPVQNSTLANISTRGFVQSGDNVLIGGFIYLGGSGATNVVIRGIGPSLAAAHVANPLADPVLEIHDSNGNIVAQNDDWTSDQAAIQATGLQPSNNAESALLLTSLPHGAYTAIVRGKNDTTGTAVVEAYIF